MEIKKSVVESFGARARVCWSGPNGEPVRGQWEPERSALGTVEMMRMLLGEGLCWIEYQH